jgi:hypothetical protein
MGALALAMMVAVEVSSPRALVELEQSLLAACSAGLRAGRCVSARDRTGPADAVAMVSWTEEGSALIEVGRAQPSGAEWLTRSVEFSPEDPPTERWRAVGFTIAVLIRDEGLEGGSTLVEPIPPAAPVTFHLRGGALTGSGLVRGAWRLGAGARLSAVFSSGWFVGGAAQLSGAWEADFGVTWLDLSLGGGLWWGEPRDAFSLRARVELLVENVAVEAELGGRAERANAWVPGVLTGADLLLAVADDWSVLARLDGFVLDGSTAIRAQGESLRTSAGAGLLIGVGAEYRF